MTMMSAVMVLSMQAQRTLGSGERVPPGEQVDRLIQAQPISDYTDPISSTDPIIYVDNATVTAAAETAQVTPKQHRSTWLLLMDALFSHKLDEELSEPEDNITGRNKTRPQPDQGDDEGFIINWPNFILAIVLIMLMLTTAVGNLFVIAAILIERNLRTVGNYLVLSLAIADLLVACLVMPLAGIYQILQRWTLGVLLCDIWTSADVFCCTGDCRNNNTSFVFCAAPIQAIPIPVPVPLLTFVLPYASDRQQRPSCTCSPSPWTGIGP